MKGIKTMQFISDFYPIRTYIAIEDIGMIMKLQSRYYNLLIVMANKHQEPPEKLKFEDKVKTPDSHPNEFRKNKKSSDYTHNKTGWTAKADPSNHGGPHWDMSPPRGSGHINVGPNENILGGSK